MELKTHDRGNASCFSDHGFLHHIPDYQFRIRAQIGVESPPERCCRSQGRAHEKSNKKRIHFSPFWTLLVDVCDRKILYKLLGLILMSVFKGSYQMFLSFLRCFCKNMGSFLSRVLYGSKSFVVGKEEKGYFWVLQRQSNWLWELGKTSS